MGSLAEERPRAAHLADVLKALAHPARLRIVAALCEGEESVIGLAERLGLPQAIVSQQLRILRMSGLVAAAREKGFARYAPGGAAAAGARRLPRGMSCAGETRADRARKRAPRAPGGRRGKMSVDVDKEIAELKAKVDGMPGRGEQADDDRVLG